MWTIASPVTKLCRRSPRIGVGIATKGLKLSTRALIQCPECPAIPVGIDVWPLALDDGPGCRTLRLIPSTRQLPRFQADALGGRVEGPSESFAVANRIGRTVVRIGHGCWSRPRCRRVRDQVSPGPLDTTTERATLIDVLVGYLEADCPTSVQRVDVASWHALNPAFESSGTVSGLATKNVLRLEAANSFRALSGAFVGAAAESPACMRRQRWSGARCSQLQVPQQPLPGKMTFRHARYPRRQRDSFKAQNTGYT